MVDEAKKIDRVETAVIALQKDVAIISVSLTRVAKAIEVLADMRLEVELLKQKVDTNNTIYLESLKSVITKLETTDHEVHLLSTTSTRNTIITESITKLTWIAITAIVGYVVWILSHLSKS